VVNDFETVRETLKRLWPHVWRGDDALAALDRIKAEVKRLRAALEVARDEQWAGSHCSTTCVCRDETRAEVERLRADNSKMLQYGESLGWIHLAEVERLRAILKDRDLEIEDLNAEVGRLRVVRDAAAPEPHRLDIHVGSGETQDSPSGPATFTEAESPDPAPQLEEKSNV